MNIAREMMEKIDSLSLRERAAVFLAILAVIFFIWDSYLMNSLNNHERRIRSQLQQKQAEQTALNAELEQLIGQIRHDPNVQQRDRLESLRRQLEETREEVLGTTRQLVAPGRMAGILENVLARTEGLDLIEVRGLGRSPLLDEQAMAGSQEERGTAGGNGGADEDMDPEADPGQQARALSQAWKHGLRIVFNGSFMATLEYVRDLESLENTFIWDELELEITDYPQGRASITVYTISLDKAWIGA